MICSSRLEMILALSCLFVILNGCACFSNPRDGIGGGGAAARRGIRRWGPHPFDQQGAATTTTTAAATTRRMICPTATTTTTAIITGATTTGIPRIVTRARQHEWEGDDMRWLTRARRRLARYGGTADPFSLPVRNVLVATNVLTFLYQTVDTVSWIRRRHPSYWPGRALPIVFDAALGSARPGPFTRYFAHSAALSAEQPYRYLTAGFLHGGLVHLLLNMNSMRNLPSWLETGLGSALYLTAFLVSVVTGNIGHTLVSDDVRDGMSLCLGASGGICGLYGLMYASLVKMGNGRAAGRVLRGMATVVLYGSLLSRVSNAAHAGGFLGGVVVGVLCGPNYERNYAARRKNSLDVDTQPRDYRLAMGFGTRPTKRGIVPLPAAWIAVVLAVMSSPTYRAVPRMIWRGLARPPTGGFWPFS